MGRGDRRSSRNFVVFVADADPQFPKHSRIGITVSKRVGNAVARNHLKRRIREWYRTSRQRLPAGAELVVIARRPARELATRLLFEDLDRVTGTFQTGTAH